jgi:hypothetical protein
VRPLDITDRDESDALVIRIDYSDERAWQEVAAALVAPMGEFESYVHLVDDPAWAGASVEEVLAAVPGHRDVVFLADRTTMQADHHALLAVTTLTREDCEDDAEYEAHVEFGREFRTVPAGVSGIHANLWIANMDFQEFTASAHVDPESVYRA